MTFQFHGGFPELLGSLVIFLVVGAFWYWAFIRRFRRAGHGWLISIGLTALALGGFALLYHR